jgi:catalase (peroxidase I)
VFTRRPGALTNDFFVNLCNDSKRRFVDDFVAAWDKVMNLD